MKLVCIQDVVMSGEGDPKLKGVVAFSKGKEYRGYHYTMRDDYDFIPTLAAKNDWGERHIIRRKDGSTDEFFNRHFKVIDNARRPKA